MGDDLNDFLSELGISTTTTSTTTTTAPPPGDDFLDWLGVKDDSKKEGGNEQVETIQQAEIVEEEREEEGLALKPSISTEFDSFLSQPEAPKRLAPLAIPPLEAFGSPPPVHKEITVSEVDAQVQLNSQEFQQQEVLLKEAQNELEENIHEFEMTNEQQFEIAPQDHQQQNQLQNEQVIEEQHDDFQFKSAEISPAVEEDFQFQSAEEQQKEEDIPVVKQDDQQQKDEFTPVVKQDEFQFESAEQQQQQKEEIVEQHQEDDFQVNAAADQQQDEDDFQFQSAEQQQKEQVTPAVEQQDDDFQFKSAEEQQEDISPAVEQQEDDFQFKSAEVQQDVSQVAVEQQHQEDDFQFKSAESVEQQEENFEFKPAEVPEVEQHFEFKPTEAAEEEEQQQETFEFKPAETHEQQQQQETFEFKSAETFEQQQQQEEDNFEVNPSKAEQQETDNFQFNPSNEEEQGGEINDTQQDDFVFPKPDAHARLSTRLSEIEVQQQQQEEEIPVTIQEQSPAHEHVEEVHHVVEPKNLFPVFEQAVHAEATPEKQLLSSSNNEELPEEENERPIQTGISEEFTWTKPQSEEAEVQNPEEYQPKPVDWEEENNQEEDVADAVTENVENPEKAIEEEEYTWSNPTTTGEVHENLEVQIEKPEFFQENDHDQLSHVQDENYGEEFKPPAEQQRQFDWQNEATPAVVVEEHFDQQQEHFSFDQEQENQNNEEEEQISEKPVENFTWDDAQKTDEGQWHESQKTQEVPAEKFEWEPAPTEEQFSWNTQQQVAQAEEEMQQFSWNNQQQVPAVVEQFSWDGQQQQQEEGEEIVKNVVTVDVTQQSSTPKPFPTSPTDRRVQFEETNVLIDRVELWSSSLKAFQKKKLQSQEDDDEDEDEPAFDSSVSPSVLEVLDSISVSKFRGASLIWALENCWDRALTERSLGFSQGRVSVRNGTLFKSLVAYHDPELCRHLDSLHSNWNFESSLFGFYSPPKPILHLWDLGIVQASEHVGFENPQIGSFFFALGLLEYRREILLNTSSQILEKFEEIQYWIRNSEESESKKVTKLALPLAMSTPKSFRHILNQVELDLQSLASWPVYDENTISEANESDDDEEEELLVDEKHHSHAHPEPSTTTAAAAAPSGGTASWSKFKEMTSIAAKAARQFTKQLSGPIDAEPNQPATRYSHLLVLEQNHIGAKLVASQKQGLTIAGFPIGVGEPMKHAGARIGDVIHAVNGATVLFLSPAVAEQVAQRQETPLYILTSSTKKSKKELNPERVKEAKKMLYKGLKELYTKHGPSKVDRITEILELYAGNEDVLLKSLHDKYGEYVPGDEQLKSEYLQISPSEIVDLLEQPDDIDHLLLDVREINERADTGVFAACLLFGQPEVYERARMAKRIYLIGSGRPRELSLFDPIKSKIEQSMEDERIKTIMNSLWNEGVKQIAVVSGGYSEISKELNVRNVDVLVIGQGNGAEFKLLDSYLKLDYEDAISVANFLNTQCGGGIPAKLLRTDSGHSIGSFTGSDSGVSAALPEKPALKIKKEKAGFELAEEDDEDLLNPTSKPTGSSKAADSAHKISEMATNTWSKWVAPAITKRKFGE